MKGKVNEISFRDVVSDIPNTSYLTHGIYPYPAKFIPHIARFCIDNFTKKGDWILDPFAGSGTVGVEAMVTNRNATLLDINPILNELAGVKFYQGHPLDEDQLDEMLVDILASNAEPFVPSWANMDYWYAPEVRQRLEKLWGNYYKQMSQQSPSSNGIIYGTIIRLALLKLSRRLSYAEDTLPKLFSTDRKRESIADMLKRKKWWLDCLRQLRADAAEILRAVNKLAEIMQGRTSIIEAMGGIDSTSTSYIVNKIFDAVITSPPYLYAQEYIRTVKLELYWLGYDDDHVRKLAHLEIPYKRADDVISTPVLEEIKSKIAKPELVHKVDAYFYHTLNVLRTASEHLVGNGRLCILVGDPVCDGVPVEIWRVLVEYFGYMGYVADVYRDRIKSRRLFGGRQNKNTDGMKVEYLVVLRRK